MPAWFENLIRSRGFWSALGPAILAVLRLFDVELGTEQEEALFVLISIMAGWLGVTIVRGRLDQAPSYAEVMQILRHQEATIRVLTAIHGQKNGASHPAG